MQKVTMAQGRFVVPLCLDFRSRIYGRALFNFQGPDFVRGLFYFADGRRIGAEGLRQLKYHVAGLADGHDWDGAAKPSRLLPEEREAWCDSNMARIRALSAAMTRGEYLAGQAEKAGAACQELARADQIGPDFITHLPMSLR